MPAAPLPSDIVWFLVNLGYTREVADRAVLGALDRAGADADLEALLRAALAGLVR